MSNIWMDGCLEQGRNVLPFTYTSHNGSGFLCICEEVEVASLFFQMNGTNQQQEKLMKALEAIQSLLCKIHDLAFSYVFFPPLLSFGSCSLVSFLLIHTFLYVCSHVAPIVSAFHHHLPWKVSFVYIFLLLIFIYLLFLIHKWNTNVLYCSGGALKKEPAGCPAWPLVTSPASLLRV
jgi:hypothetical protein